MTLKAITCAVMVVPTFAPRITPTAWESDISPELMKPTTITVVTDEDWITDVTKAPVSTPMKRLRVSCLSSIRRRSPATARSATVICSSPNRKSASPPSSPTTRGRTSGVVAAVTAAAPGI